MAVVQGLPDAQKEVEMVSSYALDDGAPNSLVSRLLLRAQASSAECSRPRVEEGRAGGFRVRAAGPGVASSAPMKSHAMGIYFALGFEVS
jgi:hypothetical protein